MSSPPSPLKLAYSTKSTDLNKTTPDSVNAFGLSHLRSLPLSRLTMDQKVLLIQAKRPRLANALKGLVDDLVMRVK